MLPQQESPLVQRSNRMEDAGIPRGHRKPGNMATFLCGCCFGSHDSAGAEKSFFRPSWFQKTRRSTSGPDAADSESENWLRRGWNSVRQAGEWPESVMEEYSGGCCSGPKWRQFARRFKADGKAIYNSRPARFHYDALSYKLNFDDGLGPDGEFNPAGKASESGAP